MLLLTLVCFILAFWPAFQKLIKQWSSGDNDYCYLIIPLFLYLLWERRDSFEFGEFSWAPWGLLFLLLSLLVAVTGEIASVVTILFFGLWCAIIGLAIVFYGSRLRFLSFPVFILLFMVPLPPFINRVLTFKLKLLVSTLSVKILEVIGFSVFREGNIIDLGFTKLQVIDACSGMRYLLPLVLMSILTAHFFVKGRWKKIFLIVLSVPLSVLVNTIRIVATAMLIEKGYSKLAEGFYHDFSGWLVFMLALGFLIIVSLVLKRFPPYVSPGKPIDPGARKTGGISPLLVTISACLLLTFGGWALRELPSSYSSPTRHSFSSFPMQIDGWKGKREFLPEAILNSLWADDYVSASYSKPGARNVVHLFIPYYEYQGTRHTAHAPQSCLLGSGWNLLKSMDRSMNFSHSGDVTVRELLLQKGDEKILATYFFFQRGRVIISPWMNKYYLMVDAMTKRRTDGALVRIEIPLAPDQSVRDVQQVLGDFLARLLRILPRYVPL